MQHLLIFRLWVIIFTQERASLQPFPYLNSIIKTLKKECEICLKLIMKTPERSSIDSGESGCHHS